MRRNPELHERRFGATVATLLLSLIVSVDGAPSEHADEIRELVERSVDVNGPGVAISVRRSGSLAYVRGFGLADVKARQRVTPDSLFDLASVSKHITGLAILTLVEAGKVKLNAPVANYLADYHVPTKGRAVTIADLLHHISGLADYTGDDWDGTDEEFAALTLATHLKWLNTTKPHRAPGLKFVYNNSEYVLLATVIEQVSGLSFANFVREHLFARAGMADAFVFDGPRRFGPSVVKGYITTEDGEVKPSSLLATITGDGNVYSSISDLARWLTAIDEGKIVSAKLAAVAYENGRYDDGKPIRDEDGNGYGFGWVVAPTGKKVWHTGGWSGTSTYIIRDFDNQLDVVVLSNDENADVESLGDDILGLFNSE